MTDGVLSTTSLVLVTTEFKSGGGLHSFDFCDLISVDNLLHSWKEFSNGKKSKKDVAHFELSLEDNIFQLHDALVAGSWTPNPYVAFYVQDPKLRKIHKASVRDRVLHQAVYRALYQLFDKNFIHDSYSSRNFKGTHAGVKRFGEFARKVTANYSQQGFALKCDIRKFFDSIDHVILLHILKRKITDDRFFDLITRIVVSFETVPGKGLPLGNVTSQILANVYMNEFDQFMKHTLKSRFYLRYCDDFVIVHNSENFLKSVIPLMSKFLSEELRLTLHPNKISLRKVRQGIDFLGYVSLPNYRVLRTRTKNRMIAKIHQARLLYACHRISSEKFNSILTAYAGVLSHCKSRKLLCYIHPMPPSSTTTYSSLLNTPHLLSGRTVRDSRLPLLVEKIDVLTSKGIIPTLAIIQVGDRPDSTIYVNVKKNFAQKIGARTLHLQLSEMVSQTELIAHIGTYNDMEAVHGIIVQLPLPSHLNRDEVIEMINPAKDVDGLTSTNQKKLLENDSTAVIPATARGVFELLDHYSIDLAGKKVTVIGRSKLVGTPLAVISKHRGAEVIIAHSQTSDLISATKNADILMVATGKPGLIQAEHVSKGQIVIDVGLTKLPEGSLRGDVHFDAVKDIVSAITPVPGGAGPMTVLALFENLIDVASK
jgi:5,10-methylene-tetrahydrofolate dehydrogenase/methenyl tetrahydrofolate cyclohydrolase/retron-type reverse transcriptase